MEKPIKKDKILKKNNRFKRFSALFFILVILNLTLVFAMEWDNVKEYQDKDGITDKVVVIDNALGLGERIATVELMTPKANKVIEGKDRKVLIYDIDATHKDLIYKNAIGSLEIKNMYSGQNVNKEFHYEYAIYETVEVEDWEWQCEIIEKEQHCNKKITGTHEEEQIIEWRRLEGDDLPKGKITIALVTDVHYGDYYDGIFTLYGEKLTRHATWQESYNTNLEIYLPLNESGNMDNATDSINQVSFNGTNIGTGDWVSGLIGNAVDLTTVGGERFKMPNGLLADDQSFSFTIWVQGDAGDFDGRFFCPNNDVKMFWGYRNQGMRYYDGTYYNDIFPFNAGDWTFIAVTYNGTGMDFYKNGSLAGIIITNPTGTIGDGNYFGCYPDGSACMEGLLDEFALWPDRVLTAGEIEAMYNNGAGMTYTTLFNPTVTLNDPPDYTEGSLNMSVNCSGSKANYDLLNLSLYLDGVINYTVSNTSASASTLDLFIDQNYPEGIYNWTCAVYDLGDGFVFASSNRTFNITRVTPTITLTSPENYYNSTGEVNINCSVDQGDFPILNLTLLINGEINYTLTNSSADTTSLSINDTFTYSDGSYNWSCEGYDLGDYIGSTSNRTFTIDGTNPVVNSAYNLINLTATSFPINSSWNYTASDLHINTCYYHTSDNSSNTTITCNASLVEIEWSSAGNKLITYCANDTFGLETCLEDLINVAQLYISQYESRDPVGEGDTINYYLQLNMTNIPTTRAYLYFNNTIYFPTTTQAGTNQYNFTYSSLQIPKGYGSTTGNMINWTWNYTMIGYENGNNISTGLTNTTVYKMDVDNCSSYGEIILNLSLKDEELNEFMNLTDRETNIEIDLNLTRGDYSWNYSSQWNNQNNVSVCIPFEVLNNTNYTIDFTIGFDSDDYVNEFIYLDNGTLSYGVDQFNSLTDKTIDLMDLLSADSTSFLFNYFDADGLVVDDIIVHTFRKYIGQGIFREIERSKQNDDGDTVIHLVEEDVIYYFVISKEGAILFTSNTYTALCQDTPCEIQLEESGGFEEFNTTDWDLIDNGAYTINSDSLTREVNFTYALTSSSEMNLTIYKLGSDGAYSVVASDTDTGTSGSIILSVPVVSGNTSFFAGVYQDGEFKKSQWVDFEEDAGLYFGNTLSLFLGALIILALGLMAVSEGSGTIIFLMLGMFIAMVLGVVDYRTSTGLNILIYFIIAGGILLWKITRRNR